ANIAISPNPLSSFSSFLRTRTQPRATAAATGGGLAGGGHGGIDAGREEAVRGGPPAADAGGRPAGPLRPVRRGGAHPGGARHGQRQQPRLRLRGVRRRGGDAEGARRRRDAQPRLPWPQGYGYGGPIDYSCYAYGGPIGHQHDLVGSYYYAKDYSKTTPIDLDTTDTTKK
ncbi:Os03g0770100, partial [Oryza sativa Japonica Group]